MRKHLSTIILIVILIAGLSLLLYPTVSDYWNSFHQSRAISTYTEQVEQIDTGEQEAALARARAYNAELWNKSNRYEFSEAEEEEYENLLNISDTSMIGYIEIPSINCRLPIYHGMSQEVLQTGVGHMKGSSLPVGGLGTHSVLTAHRGLPSATLFTNLDKMEEGDYFVLHVLGETMTYEIDQIHIVLPDDVDDLELEKGKDYCTLVTCTPYGVNSHRLLLRGHRTENQAAQLVQEDAKQINSTMVSLIIAGTILLILFIGTLIRYRK